MSIDASPAEQDVLGHGAGEEVRFLGDVADECRPAGRCRFGAGHQDTAAVRPVEARQEPTQRALS